MFIVKNRKIFYAISGLLVVASIASLVVFGLHFGIDFKGGSLIEVSYNETRPELTLVQEELGKIPEIAGYSIRPTGEKGFILRTAYLDEKVHSEVLAALFSKNKGKEKRFDSIGPTLGSELQRKALLSLGLVLLAIVGFITFAFRKVSEPVSSWKYGL